MDKIYWKNYYKKNRESQESSNFAKFLIDENYFSKKSNLIELGCGNGRDSLFFVKNGLKVTGVDQVKDQINYLKKKSNKNINFLCSDFTNLNLKKKYDIVYSRFTLHSITKEEQTNVIKWSFNVINQNGLLCIEVRGKKNSLYGKGEKVSNEIDAFIYDNHYRRFVDINSLCEELIGVGFTIEISEESTGFAPFGNQNDFFIRIICKK